jgi:hypothetical protein
MMATDPEADPAPSLTLTDDDIGTTRGIGRRAFLLGAVGSTAALAGCAEGISDADAGPRADPSGMGRGTVSTGITDADVGAGSDPVGRGRGVRRVSGLTDSDSGYGADPAGNGRGRVVRASGRTDSDNGDGSDPVGNGRGRPRSCTDSDVGPVVSDPVGRGRRC